MGRGWEGEGEGHREKGDSGISDEGMRGERGEGYVQGKGMEGIRGKGMEDILVQDGEGKGRKYVKMCENM